jgi:hypothetical protein
MTELVKGANRRLHQLRAVKMKRTWSCCVNGFWFVDNNSKHAKTQMNHLTYVIICSWGVEGKPKPVRNWICSLWSPSSLVSNFRGCPPFARMRGDCAIVFSSRHEPRISSAVSTLGKRTRLRLTLIPGLVGLGITG